MSRFASAKTAQIWAKGIAQCERSNAAVAQFFQSIGCSTTSYFTGNRKIAAKPLTNASLRCRTSGTIDIAR